MFLNQTLPTILSSILWSGSSALTGLLSPVVFFPLPTFLPMSEERYFFSAYAEKLNTSTDTVKTVFSPSAGTYNSLPRRDRVYENSTTSWVTSQPEAASFTAGYFCPELIDWEADTYQEIQALRKYFFAIIHANKETGPLFKYMAQILVFPQTSQDKWKRHI